MANNSLRAEGRFSLCRRFPSVFISSISSFPSSFCRSCLCQVTRQLFPPSLVRVLWAVAFEYNGPVDAPSLPLWLHQYFLLSLSLSFLPPSLLQGSRLLCARLGFLQSSVLFAFLSAQSSVSSFVMMRSLVGPVVPPFPFFFLFSVSSLRLYTLQLRHHLPNGLKSVEPGELKGSRLA